MAIQLSEFRKNLLYQIQAPLVNILDDLTRLREIDSLSEQKQKEYGRKALFYFLGLLISLLIIVILSGNGAVAGILAVIVTVLVFLLPVLIIALIYALIKRSRFKRLNINNARYYLAQQILEMLSRDMDADTNFEMQLSFQDIQHNQNKLSTHPHPYKSGWKVDNFSDTWLKLKGKFIDKTQFELTLTEILKKEYGWKRGRSGKQKYKSKNKPMGLDINLNLSYSAKKYGAIKILQDDINNAVKLPQSSILRGLKVSDKAIRMNVRITPEYIQNEGNIYQTITSMFLSSYQVLNLAKIIAK